MTLPNYYITEGKFGEIHHFGKYLQIRLDRRGKWTIFSSFNGKRRNKTVGNGRNALKKALKLCNEISKQLNSPSIRGNASKDDQSKPLFSTYSTTWLNESSGRWDDQTYERYEGLLRLHILPDELFREKRLDEFNRSIIKRFLRNLLRRRSSSTVGLAHIVLNGVFSEAVDDEIISTNPVNGTLRMVLPPVRKRRVREVKPFRIVERDRFLETGRAILTFKEYLMIKVMAHMGLRNGEVLAMRQKNIDFQDCKYEVKSSFKQMEFRSPKMGKDRFVEIPRYLLDDFKQHIAQLKRTDLLFHDPKEKGYWPFSQRKVQGMVRKVCKAAGMEIRRPHDLRHTYATILLQSGISPMFVQKQLGHSSIAITCDIYGHWIPGAGRKGLESALSGK